MVLRNPSSLANRLYFGLHTGNFVDSLKHCDAGFALYDREKHHSHVTMYWMDPGVGCLCYGAWSLMCLGYPDQSLERVNKAIELARASEMRTRLHAQIF